MIGDFPAVLNFNWLFLKLHWFICNWLPVLLDHSFEPKCALSLYHGVLQKYVPAWQCSTVHSELPGVKWDLSFISNWVLVGNWLFCAEYFPCSESFWFMLEVSAEVWTKNSLYGFVGSHSCFNTSIFVCQNEFDQQYIHIESCLFKPPHQIHACTKT